MEVAFTSRFLRAGGLVPCVRLAQQLSNGSNGKRDFCVRQGLPCVFRFEQEYLTKKRGVWHLRSSQILTVTLLCWPAVKYLYIAAHAFALLFVCH